MPNDPHPVDTSWDTLGGGAEVSRHKAGNFDDLGDADWEGTFLMGDLTGANARQAQRRQDYARQQALNLWGGAQEYAPSASDISNPYNYDPTDAGLNMLISQQGLTPGAKSAYAAMTQQAGQQSAATRQAIQQQMVARGMGASGANYAAQLAAGQEGANQAAMGGYQAVAQGEAARNAAIGQQAGIRAQQRAAYAGAQERGLQDVYNNYLQMVAGMTGQYNNAQNAYAQREQQSNDSNKALWEAAGTVGAALIA
jgi:hypothetical protein